SFMLFLGVLGFLTRGLFQVPLAGQEIRGIENRQIDLQDAEAVVVVGAGVEGEDAGINVREVHRLVVGIQAGPWGELGDAFGSSAIKSMKVSAALGHRLPPLSSKADLFPLSLWQIKWIFNEPSFLLLEAKS